MESCGYSCNDYHSLSPFAQGHMISNVFPLNCIKINNPYRWQKKMTLIQTSEINWTKYSLKDHLILKTCSIPNVACKIRFIERIEAKWKISGTTCFK